MQKRRGTTAGSGSKNSKNDADHHDAVSVSVGGGDGISTSTTTTPPHSPKTSKPRRRQRRISDNTGGATTSLAFDPLAALFILFMTAGVVLLLLRLIGGGGDSSSSLHQFDQEKERRHHQHDKKFGTADQGHRRLLPPLYQFESLQYPLQHSQLVGLYFAASWCPMSTPVTRMIDEYLGPILLPSPPPTATSHQDEHANEKLSIVYISSDKSESSMKDYIKPNWFVVPYNHHDRSNLKRHFSVCARIELAELEMERKFEIPTLILLDASTQSVITTSGVHDLYERGAQAMDYWMDLLHKMRELQEKYQH